jgi:hypothetical protein
LFIILVAALNQYISWLCIWGFYISIHCDLYSSNEICWPCQFVQKKKKKLIFLNKNKTNTNVNESFMVVGLSYIFNLTIGSYPFKWIESDPLS